jgi:enterochelin esterase-like enzyme
MRHPVRVPRWAVSIISDFTDMHRAPRPVSAAKVPRFTLALPDDVRFEYAFLDGGGRVRADPDHGASGANPWYPEITEVRGPNYVPQPLAEPPPAEPAWRERRWRLAAAGFDAPRRVNVLSPPDHPGPLPVVVLHDGIAYQRLARTADVLAALVAQGRARPAHLVFGEPGDRLVEYAWDERHQRFVSDVLRPEVERELATDGTWIAMGASLGGLAAATLALRDPSAWSVVVAQGGAFLGIPEERRHHGVRRSWLLERLRAGAELADQRWILDVGTLDWLHDVNQRVADALAARGTPVWYGEWTAGHNWGCWRDGLARVLEAALPPPPEQWPRRASYVERAERSLERPPPAPAGTRVAAAIPSGP